MRRVGDGQRRPCVLTVMGKLDGSLHWKSNRFWDLANDQVVNVEWKSLYMGSWANDVLMDSGEVGSWIWCE